MKGTSIKTLTFPISPHFPGDSYEWDSTEHIDQDHVSYLCVNTYFRDFTYRGSLIQVPGVSMYMCMYVSVYLSVSHALRISETSESEFWNIPE